MVGQQDIRGGIYTNLIKYTEYPEYKTNSTIPWNIELIKAPFFWAKTKGGGRVIAIVDTGLNVSHPEFAGRVYNPVNCTGVGAYNDVTDTDGHGTHVAGTVAGKTVGVCPECRVMPLKVFGGTNSSEAIRKAFIAIIEHNANCNPVDKVVAVNCSFGSAAYDPMLAYNIRTLVSDGVAVCVAAGNSGDGNPETEEIFSYPAYINEVITTVSINQDESIANYSNSFDGVDIAAPGTYIYSSWKDGGYNTISGTSMATPHITGTCALLADYYYQKYGKMPLEGDIEAELFGRIRAVDADKRLFGKGILDLSIEPNIACKEGYMWLNRDIAVIDGTNRFIDQPLTYDPTTCRTLAPVRFLLESAGFNVDWDQALQQVHFYR